MYEEGTLNKKLMIAGIIIGVILIGVIVYLIVTREKPVTKTFDPIQVGERYAVDMSHIKKDIEKLDFVSSDESVATINENGVVEGKKIGSTTIQIKDDKYDYVTIDINVEQTDSKITLEYIEDEITLEIGEAYNIKHNIKDFNKITEEFKFNSLSKKVATIDEFGNIRALDEGNTTIVTSLKGKHIKINCNIVVVNKTEEKEMEEVVDDEESTDDTIILEEDTSNEGVIDES